MRTAVLAATLAMITACGPNGDNQVDTLYEQLAAWKSAVEDLDGVSKASTRGPAGASVMSASVYVWYPEGIDVVSDDISAVLAAVTDATDPEFYDWTITVSPGLEAPGTQSGVSLVDLTTLVDDPDLLLGAEHSVTMHGDGTPLVDSGDDA